MDYSAIGDGITSARVNVDGRLAVHEHFDMEPVVVVTVIHPEGHPGTVGLRVFNLIVQYSAREVQGFVAAGSVAHILS